MINKGITILALVVVVFSAEIILLEPLKQNIDREYASINDTDNVTILLVGDIMLGRNVGGEPFRYVKLLIHPADISSGNLEYVITESNLIFYSLGNFVFDQEHEVTKNAYAIRIKLNKDAKIVNLEKINIRIDDSTPFIISKERLI